MATTTTNFGWDIPQSTDLVKDGATAIATLGQDIDTSMVDLKGGTTGQILSKTSNTDMDFTWINNDQGDITGITATSPLTGGGASGAITVGIQDGTTAQKGAVQLTDSTASTSTTTAATPNSVKSSYDLAAAAIPKNTVTTNGDLIYGTGASTISRLGIGSSGQVLAVSSGIPAWITPAAAYGITEISTTTLSGTSTTISGISGSSYSSLWLVITGLGESATNSACNITINGTSSGYVGSTSNGAWATYIRLLNVGTTNNHSVWLQISNVKATSGNKYITGGHANPDAGTSSTFAGYLPLAAAISSITINGNGSATLSGSARLIGA